MRSLPDLLSTDEGCAFLRARGLFTDVEAFVAALRAPARTPPEPIGTGAAERIVYVGHQLLADHPASVEAKFRLLEEVARREGVSPLFAWLDTDRVGSQPAIATILWEQAGLRVRLASNRARPLETRFVPVDHRMVRDAMDTVVASVTAAGGDVARAERVREVACAPELRSLADVTLALSTHVLAEHVGSRGPHVLVSRLHDRPEFRDAVVEVLSALDDVVVVFNAAVDSLAAAGVDPLVHPLGDTYLPLHYSCPKDGSRKRLARERSPGRPSAVATCGCGDTFRFPLDDGLDELAATGRWSVDVTFPVMLDPFVSGVVAGRSSAIYGLVMNEVIVKVLGREPVPALVPAQLRDSGAATSMLHDFLMGRA